MVQEGERVKSRDQTSSAAQRIQRSSAGKGNNLLCGPRPLEGGGGGGKNGMHGDSGFQGGSVSEC